MSIGNWKLVWKDDNGNLAEVNENGSVSVVPSHGAVTIPAAVMREIAAESAEARYEWEKENHEQS